MLTRPATTLLSVVIFFLGMQPEQGSAQWTHGVVAADHPLASQAGLEMLQQGGNVVDAAVATSFALAVTRPYSCGLGGGGFMMIYLADDQSAVMLDYRERAPSSASDDMFHDDPKSSRKGGLAAGIPGTVAGLCYAHRQYGKLPFTKVIEPSIRLARDGYPIDVFAVNIITGLINTSNDLISKERFPPLWKGYLYDGKLPQVGDTFKSPLLPLLLKIQKEQERGFYTGEVARSLVKTSNRQGGIWTEKDLENSDHRVVPRTPLATTFDGYQVFAAPPPSSGGVAMIEGLQIISALEAKKGRRVFEPDCDDDVETLHVLTEVFKHVFADRSRYLGDPDHVSVKFDALLAEDYARNLAGKISLKSTRPTQEYGTMMLPIDGGTSHFSVIDREGNAVACTETINDIYGCCVVDPANGDVLNNEMDDFTTDPDKPNLFGLMQSRLNMISPNKRPLSSMTPTIVVKDGRAVASLGASGGPRIITATMQVFLNIFRKGQSASQAVTSPRIHHQWVPDKVILSQEFSEHVAEGLQAKGHVIDRSSHYSAAQAVFCSPNGELSAGSDPKKGGVPAGY